MGSELLCRSPNTFLHNVHATKLQDLNLLIHLDPVSYQCLGISGMEPLKESNFIVMQERLLEDVGDTLMLLCMRRWVLNVAGNDGLIIR